MFNEATRLRAQEWLDELYACTHDTAERERYFGALSMLETLGIHWTRNTEGLHTLTYVPQDTQQEVI